MKAVAERREYGFLRTNGHQMILEIQATVADLMQHFIIGVNFADVYKIFLMIDQEKWGIG